MDDEAKSMQQVSPARERVERLEASMLAQPQIDCPVRHHFAPGIYGREINIPKGTVLIGAVHKTDNLVVVSKGRLKIVTDDGTTLLEAGDTLLCRAGVKNAAVALEDTRWTNFLHNPEDVRDTAKLVEMFTYAKESDLLGGATNQQLAASKSVITQEKSCHSQK